MRILPPILVDSAWWYFPMAERTALELLGYLFHEDGPPAEHERFAKLFFADPPFAVWLVLRYQADRGCVPPSLEVLAGWFGVSWPRILVWQADHPYSPPTESGRQARAIATLASEWIQRFCPVATQPRCPEAAAGKAVGISSPSDTHPSGVETSPDSAIQSPHAPSGGDCSVVKKASVADNHPLNILPDTWHQIVTTLLDHAGSWVFEIRPNNDPPCDHEVSPKCLAQSSMTGTTDVDETNGEDNPPLQPVELAARPNTLPGCVSPKEDLPVGLSSAASIRALNQNPVRATDPSWERSHKGSWPTLLEDAARQPQVPALTQGRWCAWDIELAGSRAALAWVAALAESLPTAINKLRRLAELESRFHSALEEAKVEALAEFSAGASHELNNPLAIISGRAQLLLKTERDPQRQHDLATIVAQAQRAHEMLADLRIFARPPRPQLRQVDLVELIRDVVQGFEEGASLRNIRVQLEAPSFPIFCRLDPAHFAAAVRAIVDNAIEAIGREGIVSLRTCTEDHHAVVEVVDNGPGIPAEIRPRIFDPFFSGRPAGRGLGFGLCKAWQIVRSHGGTILVDSTPGTGTCVRIILPRTHSPTDRSSG